MSDDTQRYIRHFLETERELASLREQLAKVTAERNDLYDSVNSKRSALEQAGHQLADLRESRSLAIRERDEARARLRKATRSHLTVIGQHEAREMKGETE